MSEIDQQLRAALTAEQDTMTLLHDNAVSASLLARRSEAEGIKRGRRARWMVPAGLVIVLGGGAAAATAGGVFTSQTNSEFRDLHPEKSQVDDHFVEPHELLGSFAQGDGTSVRAYVTTKPGRDSCFVVEMVSTKTGEEQSSLGACGRLTTDDLQQITGALIGVLPGTHATEVTISASGGYTQKVKVVNQHFLAPPPTGTSEGDTFTVTGKNTAGRTLFKKTLAVD